MTTTAKGLKNNKYFSGGYRPQATRARSKDGRNDGLRSSNLLKKGSWNNTVAVGKGFNQSPLKKQKYSDSNEIKLGEEPNYTKPIHNKKKNKQNTIGKAFILLIKLTANDI